LWKAGRDAEHRAYQQRDEDLRALALVMKDAAEAFLRRLQHEDTER
jgi:hypothetical protein